MKLPFFLLILFLTSLLPAQDAILQWTDERYFQGDDENNQVIGSFGSYLYTVSSSNPDPRNSLTVHLNLYDVKGLEYFQGIEIMDAKSDINFEKVLITDSYVHVFTSYYDRNLGFKILSVQVYDPITNKLTDPIRVDEVVQTDKNDYVPFYITSSPNGNYILIHHPSPNVTGYAAFNLKVINEEYKLTWEKEITLNYKDRMVTYEDLVMDDASTVYLMASVNPYGIKRTSGFGTLLNLKNTLFTYRPFRDMLNEYEFALTRNWIQGVKMTLDQHQNLIASAFYTYPNDYKIRGFVQFKIDGESGESLMKKMTVLSKDQFQKVEGAVNRLKDYSRKLVGSTGIYPGSSHMNNSSTEFSMKDLHFTSSMMVMSVEALRRDERCTESFNEQQMIVNCEKHFLYGDILLFFVDLNGDVLRVESVPKLQHSVDRMTPYYSFNITSDDKHLFLFYNDDSDNIEGNANMALTRLGRARMNVKVFTSSGIPSPMVVNRGSENGVLFLPSRSEWLDGKELLLYSQKEKNYKFGKLLLR